MSNKTNLANQGLILIGFGDHSLADLLEGVKSDPEKMHELAYMSVKHPPHYRAFSASTIDEQTAFIEYMELMKEYVGEELDE